MENTNEFAAKFKLLHQPSKPLVVPNIWDLSSLNAVASLNAGDDNDKPVKAIATASWAIADSMGLRDEDLTFKDNMAAIARLAPFVRAAGLPFSVDLQDGYGDRIEEAVASAVNLGAVGANIEDSIPSAGFDQGLGGSLYRLDVQVARLKSALEAATRSGCPDFVLNARCDVFCLRPAWGPSDPTALHEAVMRGRAYLEAGATTVFFWGGRGRGLTRSEVEHLVRELDGRVAVKLDEQAGALSTAELGELGVARISVGPGLYRKAMQDIREWTQTILSGGSMAT